MKYDVFISYSRNDFDEVSAFVKMLRERIPKLSLWFDILGVESGAEEFDEKIIKAIDDSSYVLFALSDNSIKSKWTKDEVLYAKNTGKNVIPVLLKDAELKGWFLFKFGRTDCIDSTSFIQVEKLTSDLSKWTLEARSERERKEREEQLRLAAEEESRLERERKEREEQLRLATEEKSRLERERKEREEQLRLATEEKSRLERERKEREEQLRLATEEKSRLERERKERDEQLRLAAEEKSRLERERKEREGQLRLATEEKSRLERELRKIERRYNLDKKRRGNVDEPADVGSSVIDVAGCDVERTDGELLDSSSINKKNTIKKYLYAVAVVLILVLVFFGRMYSVDDSIVDEYREDSLLAQEYFDNKENMTSADIKMEAELDASKMHKLSGETISNMVDLGLSVKWAICNIGAIAPEDNGYFYAWGEVSTRSDYCVKSKISKGKKRYDISGYPKYDVASNLLGGYWRIPTMKEWQELIESCKWEWTVNNGVVGYRVTSNKNGNSIFLPSTGFRSRTSHYYEGSRGYYWSSTPHEEDTYAAYGIKISDGVNSIDAFRCYYGLSVRPVCD